jgi:hypothetical protein
MFVAHASATAERTWQTLAWDTHAKAALASGDLSGAQDSIKRALAATDGVEVPVAAWQAHATAAAIARARHDAPAEEKHRQLSRDIITRLADSLQPGEKLRQTFLSAPAVAAIRRGD